MEINIRRARLPDVSAIMGVVREFASAGLMIPLSVGDTLERLRSFLVATGENGEIIGCVCVDTTWEYLVEIRSLAVKSAWQKHGVGKLLLEAALKDAADFGAREVFTLTYVPDFFKRFEFEIVPRDSLPHKVWLVCVKCPKFPDCGEVPLKRSLPAVTQPL